MKVGVLSPTTSQLVEKMAVLFPEGIDLVGPQADDHHYWNNCHLRLADWQELGLKIRIDERPFSEIDFSGYDLLIESAESFLYSKDWVNHCLRVECPVVLKACWTNDPRGSLPAAFIEKMKRFPVLLEMPTHAPNWTGAGFKDVNVIFNPVGDWWFQREWTGVKEQILFVLSGKNAWRPADASVVGFDLWEQVSARFPGKTYHHDGHINYRTPLQMSELFGESRVFVNFDRPAGAGERPITLAFTEALSAGLPVAARDLPGLDYHRYIDSNGICTNNFDVLCGFLEKCLTDKGYADKCSARSREIARPIFSSEALRPRYSQIISRAQKAFAEREKRRKRSFSFLTSWIPFRQGNGKGAAGEVFDHLADLYDRARPRDYEIDKKVQEFYSSQDYWDKFRTWEKTRDSYSIRDKAFVESAFKIDGADVVNIGCFYPWAEIEWGQRARRWTALDINQDVLKAAERALSEYPNHKVVFTHCDVTRPFELGRTVDCVLDLSTGDQLDPRKFRDVLRNYARFSDRLLLAYDATPQPFAVFDFEHYGFNALYNPETFCGLLKAAGYRILDHRPFSYGNRSYISAELRTGARRSTGKSIAVAATASATGEERASRR